MSVKITSGKQLGDSLLSQKTKCIKCDHFFTAEEGTFKSLDLGIKDNNTIVCPACGSIFKMHITPNKLSLIKDVTSQYQEKQVSLKRIAKIDIIIGSTGILFSIIRLNHYHLLLIILNIIFFGLILLTGVAIQKDKYWLKITGSIVSYLGIVGNALCFLVAIFLSGISLKYLWPVYAFSGANLFELLFSRFFILYIYLHILNIVFLFYWIYHLELIKKAIFFQNKH